MKNEFVPYKEALSLKELGFDEMCVGHYQTFEGNVINFDTISTEVCERLCKKDNFIKAPLYQQAFKWFREKFGIDVCIIPKFGDNGYGAECFKNGSLLPIELLGNEYTYKEAQDACLRKLIEIVKENKDENFVTY